MYKVHAQGQAGDAKLQLTPSYRHEYLYDLHHESVQFEQGEVDLAKLIAKWQCQFVMKNDPSVRGQTTDEYFADGHYTSDGWIRQTDDADNILIIKADLTGKWRLDGNRKLDFSETKVLSIETDYGAEFDEMIRHEYETKPDASDAILELTSKKMILKSLDFELDPHTETGLSNDFYVICWRY